MKSSQLALTSLRECLERQPSGMWFVRHGKNAQYNAAMDTLFGKKGTPK